jgi:uncharacterized protein YndB with AHSA1/START domain
MNHYQQSLLLAAPPAVVYQALTTQQGLRGWWTQDCDAETGVGGSIRFGFGSNATKAVRIEQLVPGREVLWLCTMAQIHVGGLKRKDEWVGTQIAFHLSEEGQGQTRLHFEHVGLVPEFECYDLCNQGWQFFMDSLQQYIATGRGTPFVPDAASCHGEATTL